MEEKGTATNPHFGFCRLFASIDFSSNTEAISYTFCASHVGVDSLHDSPPTTQNGLYCD